MSKLDTLCGISIVVEQPMNTPIMLNISRHVVLRQYDHCDIGIPKNNIIPGAPNGYKCHIGTYPCKFITKPFNCNIKEMTKVIMSNLRYIYGWYLIKEMKLTNYFNSCTILPYCLIASVKKSSVMGRHCDSKCRKSGIYIKIPQVENTPLVIVSYRNSRILKWRRVLYTEDGWKEDKSWSKMTMTMNEKTFILLHPITYCKQHT